MTAGNPQLNQNLTGTFIDNGALELVSIIGIGAYGVVYKALARDGKFYAVKCLNKTGLDARQRSFQRREIALHTLASSHANVVTLHNVIETPTCVYVVLSYCSDGDLFSQITEKSRYLGQDALIKDVFLQIVDAVEHCHRLGIYHRDLKPENILCDAHGTRLVLADFGLATAEKTSGDFGCGSTFYMSPECQGGLFQRLGSYSTLHNDVWSLGVILVNLTCGRNPWKQACPSDETFRAYLQNPDFLRSILPISQQCNELLKRIFALNPAARISIKELKAEVHRMGRWTMTLDELRYATRATKEAARAWAPAHILDDPSTPDAPAPKVPPQQHSAPAPRQQAAQQQQQHRSPHHAAQHAHVVQSSPKPTVHQAPASPRAKVYRDVFDSADDSTVTSIDTVEEWKRLQQQQHHLQQQHRRLRAKQTFTPANVPSPSTSPSVSSGYNEVVMSPVVKVQAMETPATAVLNIRSCNFSLSDSDGSDSGEDADMSYASRSQHKQQPTQERQLRSYRTSYVAPERQHIESFKRSQGKSSPQIPQGQQSPRTPRQLFAASHRQRKESIESSSSSSSASSDASWTGLPPTPDTPIFSRQSTAADLGKEKANTRAFSLTNARLKLAF